MTNQSYTPWVGVDLDSTLAKGIKPYDPTRIGPPTPLMVARVKQWLAEGKTIKVMTARVSPLSLAADLMDRDSVVSLIQTWTKQHIGTELPVTCEKDHAMTQLWDDREVGLIPDTGLRADGRKD